MIQCDHYHAGKVLILHKSVSSAICVSNEVVWLTLIGYFKKRFFTNSDKMLNFVNFKNGGTCVHRHILNVILRTL